MPLPKEKTRYTLADALEWDERERMEVIGGEPVLPATPVRIHQEVSGEIYRQLANYLEGKKCRVYAAPFSVRPFERGGDRPEDVDTLVEPDITVVCDPDKLDEIGCKGAPDLVMEILSPSTQRHDRVVKFNLYWRAGVREYWIVDSAGKIAQSFVLEDGYYIAKELGTAGDKMKVNVLEDCWIDLSRVFSE